MNLRIRDRCAVITGAAGGIGLETARVLLEEGARVMLTDVDEQALKACADQLDDAGDCVRFVAADLSTRDGAAAVFKACEWNVDILVHTAGVTGAKGDLLTDITDEDWAHAWQTDFMSGVRMARVFVPSMVERGWGRVVYVTSENASQPYPDEAVYNVAKAGVLSLVKAMAQTYAPKGIRVNAVAPAFIATGMTDKMMKQRAEERGVSVDEAIASFLDEERPNLVLKRRGRPDEVACVIALLCSECASFVVGSNWRVDGGSVLSTNG